MPQDASPSRASWTAKRLAYAMVAVVSMITLAFTGYYYMTLDDLRSSTTRTDALDEVPGTPDDDGADDILLAGNDSRTDAKGYPLPEDTLRALRTEHKDGIRTDTLIILRLPRNGAPPRAVSLPRDSWVAVPTGGMNKINSPFGVAKERAAARLRDQGVTDPARLQRASDQKGRAALVQTVQDFTGVRVDHYAEVSLLGFYLLTEALGGVEVCLNAATIDPDSGANFAAGRHLVGAGDALAFVRQRKNLPQGDLDRIQRQQAFLGSALHKVLSAGILTNPRKLGKLADAVRRSVVLDPGLDIIEFAERASGMASGDVQFVTIPIVAIDGRSPDGQSIVEVDPTQVREFIAGLVDTPRGGGSAAGSAAAQPVPITGGTARCVN